MSILAQSRRWYLAPRPLQVLPRFIDNSSALHSVLLYMLLYVSPWVLKSLSDVLRGRVLELPNQSLRSNQLPFAFIVIILQAPSLGTHQPQIYTRSSWQLNFSPPFFFHEDNPENTSHNMTLISGAETQPVVRFHLSQLQQGCCKLQGPKGKEGAYWPEIIQHIAISHCSLRIANCCSFFQKDIESAVLHLLIQQISPIHLRTFILKLPAAVKPLSPSN